MQITQNIKQNNSANKNSAFKGQMFYNATAELETNIPLSRALIDLAGCDVPWVIMANNKQERIEKARRYSIVFMLAFVSPMLLVPALNRFTMKHTVKLTDSLWSNTHKAMHLSNADLVSVEKMKEGLEELAKKTEMGPFEILYYKITGKKPVEQKLDLKALYQRVGNNPEKLRKKIINAKNNVLLVDFISQGVPLGCMGFINNYFTKRKTGQAGFSAELKMADKNIIEKRADGYEKNKYKRYAAFAALALGISTSLPLITRYGLKSASLKGLGGFVKRNASILDYKSGIYMSRIAFLALMAMTHGGLLIASRNKTEAKDTAIRMGTGDAVFFGGDLLMASLFANLSDGLLKTKLRKEGQTSFINKIFPKTKPIKEINRLVDKGELVLKNKQIANSLYWINLTILSAAMGFGIPTLINKMIKQDVNNDVNKGTSVADSNVLHSSLKEKDAFKVF